MTHRSQFETTLTGHSGKEYRLRFDFDAAYSIEEALGGMSPMQVVGALTSLMVPLSVAGSVLHVGMECYRKHHKSDHQEIPVSKVRKALQDIGLKRLCEEIGRPLAEVYGLFDDGAGSDDDDEADEGDELDPTTAAASGGS